MSHLLVDRVGLTCLPNSTWDYGNLAEAAEQDAGTPKFSFNAFFVGSFLAVRDAAELPAHLAARPVHDDRPAQPGQVLHRQPLHAGRDVSDTDES